MKTKIQTTAAAQRVAGHIGKLLPIAAAAFALHATCASAATLNWSYTGPGVNNGGGTFAATLQSDGSYQVFGVAGTVNGQNITGVDSFDGSDNLVFPPSPPNVGVDSNGVAFIGADGTEYDLYEDDGLFNSDSPFSCGGAVYCLISSTPDINTDTDFHIDAALNPNPVALDSFTVTLAAVPEPASWAMMLLGIGGVGALMRSRRRPAPATA